MRRSFPTSGERKPVRFKVIIRDVGRDRGKKLKPKNKEFFVTGVKDVKGEGSFEFTGHFKDSSELTYGKYDFATREGFIHIETIYDDTFPV